MCPEPIPNLWIALQPQVNSLTAGVGESAAQVQFEVKYHFACKGRIPRRMLTTPIRNFPVYAPGTTGVNADYKAYTSTLSAIPVYQPLNNWTYYGPTPPPTPSNAQVTDEDGKVLPQIKSGNLVRKIDHTKLKATFGFKG